MINIINENLIKLDIKNNNKEEIIKQLAVLIDSENRLNNFDEYVEEVLNRESLTSTGIGFGIAIPHGKCSAVKIPTVAFGRLSEGVEWDSLDDKPVQVIFLLAVPEAAASNEHLKILAALSRKLLDESFRENLLKIDDKEHLMKLLSDVLGKI